MPSHGYHGVKRLLLGSVAERVLRHANYPVLMLRHFMGAGLIFSGRADFCGLALILGRMPWNQVAAPTREKLYLTR